MEYTATMTMTMIIIDVMSRYCLFVCALLGIWWWQKTAGVHLHFFLIFVEISVYAFAKHVL